jgi:hypothetical protein
MKPISGVICNCLHATHVIGAERPWFLEAEFAWYVKLSMKEELSVIFK